MTKLEIFEYIDAAIESRWESITAKQEAFKSAKGIFFQGKITHSSLPSDGAELVPDLASDKPHYQNESWIDMGELPNVMAAALRCDTYQAVCGDGYVLTAEVEIEGVIYQKAWNVGCEDRGHDWL